MLTNILIWNLSYWRKKTVTEDTNFIRNARIRQDEIYLAAASLAWIRVMLSPFNIIRDSGFLVCRFKWTSTASSRTRFMYSSNPKNLTFSSVYWVIFLQSNLFACLFKSNKPQNGGYDEARSTWYKTWPQQRFKADYLKTLKTITLISNLMGRFIYHVPKLIIIKFQKKFRQGYNLKYTWSSLKLKIFKNMKQTLDSIGVIRWSIVWSLEIYIHFT